MMRKSRRQLLLASLGATQLALLDRYYGFSPLSPRIARASGHGPTRFLTIYVPGGWMPAYLWCPLSNAQIQTALPQPILYDQEPAYFAPDQVKNLDGSGDAMGTDGFQRIRCPRLWDEQALAMGQPDPGNAHPISGIKTNSDGWSWVENQLWDNHLVVSGVDQGTPSHLSGRISTMCGAPGAEYRAPSMHAVIAHALHPQFKDVRPLPNVNIGQAPAGVNLSLPASAGPSTLASTDTIEWLLSERSDYVWKEMRDRATKDQVNFAGESINAPTNAMDDYVLAQIRQRAGLTSVGTDAFLQQLHDGYVDVSRTLARDVVTTLENTAGIEYTAAPFWGDWPANFWGQQIGSGLAESYGDTWADPFELALRVLKADLATSVSLYAPGVQNFYFDTHGTSEGLHFIVLRGVWDIIGRMLGEMKATPLPGGGSLLDDTLVMIVSEFARTWPHAQDHWPTTSVVYAGGGIHTNRMIGNYDIGPEAKLGYTGVAVDLVDEGGDPQSRTPRSADIAHTAYKIMGVEDFFIPGGSGEIVGVRNDE